MDTVNVICIKWGTAYSAHDVNQLYRMVASNIHKHEVAFHCFTDDTAGLDQSIRTHPLPVMNCPPEKVKYVYRKEVGLCDDNLGDLNGQRVLFFDLDIILTGPIDDFFILPKNDEFYIINDWCTKGDHVGQATCYSWKVGTLGFAKEYFEAHPEETLKRFHTASQEYLSSKVIEKWGKLNFWPEEWCRSFKEHALPVWYKRPFVPPTLPEGTRLLAFHGRPKAEDAIKGIWSPKGVPFIKRLYKTIKPAPWIADYLH
ncbi:MAG: hypothetical protein ACPGXY_06500 [Alphaproteobacteria bacterium]